MMDDNRLDQLIEENIIEARTLWLDTLPHKRDLPKHTFTSHFRFRIRKIAGMQYTLLYFLKLMGVGLISVFLGYMSMFFTIMPMYPLLLFSSTQTSMLKMAGMASVFTAMIAVYFLKHLWRWLGEWSRSRELGSHYVTVAVTMSIPALAALACAASSYIRLPAWVSENAIFQLFEGGIGSIRVLVGYSIFKKLFLGNGALSWLLVYTAVFWAGNRDVDLKPIWRPLFVMGLMAGIYEAMIVLQAPHLLIWVKAGYLAALIWAFHALGIVLKLQKKRRITVMVWILVLAAVLMIADLTDADEITPRAMPLFARTLEDVFPDMESAKLSMTLNGGEVLLERMQTEMLKGWIAEIDLRPLWESDPGLIGTWRGPIQITVEITDVENPCRMTLAEVIPELHGSADRIYRLGLTFANGETYAYTGDNREDLPLEALRDLAQSQITEEVKSGPTATFTFDLSGLDGEWHLKQDMILSTSGDGYAHAQLAFNGILEQDRYICVVPIETSVQYLYIHEPIFSVAEVRDGRIYWEEYVPTNYSMESEAEVTVFPLAGY